MKTFEIRISGKVQGVWFRSSAKKVADQLGIKGFTKNEADESVRIVAQGSEDSIQHFLEWCRQGPDLARVEKVEILEKSFTEKKFVDFSIA